MSPIGKKRVALVLSGGGSRGAYEAGVLSWIFEEIYPALGPDFEFDVISGTSVGAIHAAYTAASSGMAPKNRSTELLDVWSSMSFGSVVDFGWADLVRAPLRLAGIRAAWGSGRSASDNETFGGLLDVAPLEDLVRTRVPWNRLRPNLEAGRPGTLCVAATEVTTGAVSLFMDGLEADITPWSYDHLVNARRVSLTERHVRASAAIPFLFPAVRIEDCFFVDGGLRLNTPLSPAVRLRADKVLVIGLKHEPGTTPPTRCDVESIAKPAYLLGKLLDVVLLDPIEAELRQLEILNALIEGGREAFGDDFQDRIAPYIRAKRGIGYRHVDVEVIKPSRDLGELAAACYRQNKNADRSFAGSILTRTATIGTPEQEADLLSYVYFDKAYTENLIELGREDARAQSEAIYRLLSSDPT